MKAKFVFVAVTALLASPVAAQEASAPPAAQSVPAAEPAPAAPSPVTAADLVQGATVRGTDGNVVGTIEQPDAEGAIVSTGSARLRLPLNNFQKDAQGLRIGATRAQFEAAAQASGAS